MHFLIALVIGALSALAFQPIGWWPLMILAVAGLCELVARAGSLKRALLIGWLFGLGQFVISLNWIATAFTYQAAMPAWLGWVAVVLLSLYLAIYPAMAVGLAWRFGEKSRLALVLALAGGWAITEWLRATMFTGFAWNPIAVTLADTPLIAASRWIGTYGLSIIVALFAGGFWAVLRKEWRPLTAVAVISLLLWAFPASREVPPTTPPPLRIPGAPPGELGGGVSMRPIRIVQPNIGQQDKWRPGFEVETYRRLHDLTVKGRPVQRLVFWPEAAVTDPLEDGRIAAQRQAENERLRATMAMGPGDLLLTGGLSLTSTDGVSINGATNSVYALEPLGRIIGRYDKAHLVPYGEYLPMRPLLSALGLSRLAPGDIDFADGPGPRTIQLPGAWGKVGFQLCYEIIFSGEVVDRRNRPDFIFNPSNDAWFGRWGPPQHLAQARLRAAEEGLPVVRSTPTGISALIDPHGRVLHSIPWQRPGTIDASLPNPLMPTLFARFGNIIPLTLAFLLLGAAIALSRRSRYSEI
jgi:apolipoprotein N-acyltransferase